MKSRPNRAVLDGRTVNFAICNIGPELFVDQECISPKDHHGYSKVNSLLNNAKYKLLSISSPSKPPPRKKSILSHKDTAQYRRQANDEIVNKSPQLNDLDSPVEGENLPKKLERRVLEMRGIESAPTSSRVAVNVVSLNEQAKVKKNYTDDLDYWEDPYQKFTRKYDHFKRTQNKNQIKRLGRFKSLAEIENRANSLNIQKEAQRRSPDVEIQEKKDFVSNRGRDGNRRRKKVVSEDLNKKKWLTERAMSGLEREIHERSENVPLTQRYNTECMKTFLAANISLPTQEAQAFLSMIENKKSELEQVLIKSHPVKLSKLKRLARKKSVDYANDNVLYSVEPGVLDNVQVHPIKLPTLERLVKKKSIDHTNDPRFFSIEPSVANNLHMNRKAQLKNQQQNIVKTEHKRLDKSHSISMSLFVEERLEKNKIEQYTAPEPTKKLLVNIKTNNKLMQLTSEMVQHGICKNKKNNNHLTTSVKPNSVKKSPAQLEALKKDGKRLNSKRSNTVVKTRESIMDEFINTKLEGWDNTVDFSRCEKPKLRARMFDD